MKNIWLKIVKPTGTHAKWLIFLTLAVIFVLGSIGTFDVVRGYLEIDALTVSIGSYNISAYSVLRALVTIALVFWVAAISSDFAESHIGKISTLRVANRTLIFKIVQIIIYLVAFLLALDIIGIDLTTLTIFSGALGIGLGFGLQKIASNFVSGLILLMERSIEQDDLIELADGTLGFIRRPSARYTLIETFDSKEILVPNEDLITSRVTNWTFSNTSGRVEITLGVAYSSDIERVAEILMEAAQEHPRCSITPEPRALLSNFGDSSVDFVLHFWVNDVTQGRSNAQSEVMFEIWRRFKKEGIEIPFPQRDVNLVSSLNPNFENRQPAMPASMHSSSAKLDKGGED